MIINISGFCCDMNQYNGSNVWSVVIYSHENSDFVITSLSANSFDDALSGCREIIADELSKFADNPSISPGYDYDYEIRFADDDGGEF